jgi:hypothetical protein
MMPSVVAGSHCSSIDHRTKTASGRASRRGAGLTVPERWHRIEARGVGPFVTRETFRRPDGRIVTWTSRARRKRHSLLDTGRGSTWWAPGAIGWWIGVLFAVGSTCFALGAAPRYVNAVGVAIDGVTFFVGSLFFTAAAAVASYVVPASDQPRNITLMNLGTFVGAVAFLVGAVLLLPERTRGDEADEGTGVDPSGPGGQRVHSGTGHDHPGP